MNIGLVDTARISNCISYTKSQKEVLLDSNEGTIFIGQMVHLELVVKCTSAQCPVESLTCSKWNVDSQAVIQVAGVLLAVLMFGLYHLQIQ